MNINFYVLYPGERIGYLGEGWLAGFLGGGIRNLRGISVFELPLQRALAFGCCIRAQN